MPPKNKKNLSQLENILYKLFFALEKNIENQQIFQTELDLSIATLHQEEASLGLFYELMILLIQKSINSRKKTISETKHCFEMKQIPFSSSKPLKELSPSLKTNKKEFKDLVIKIIRCLLALRKSARDWQLLFKKDCARQACYYLIFLELLHENHWKALNQTLRIHIIPALMLSAATYSEKEVLEYLTFKLLKPDLEQIDKDKKANILEQLKDSTNLFFCVDKLLNFLGSVPSAFSFFTILTQNRKLLFSKAPSFIKHYIQVEFVARLLNAMEANKKNLVQFFSIMQQLAEQDYLQAELLLPLKEASQNPYPLLKTVFVQVEIIRNNFVVFDHLNKSLAACSFFISKALICYSPPSNETRQEANRTEDLAFHVLNVLYSPYFLEAFENEAFIKNALSVFSSKELLRDALVSNFFINDSDAMLYILFKKGLVAEALAFFKLRLRYCSSEALTEGIALNALFFLMFFDSLPKDHQIKEANDFLIKREKAVEDTAFVCAEKYSHLQAYYIRSETLENLNELLDGMSPSFFKDFPSLLIFCNPRFKAQLPFFSYMFQSQNLYSDVKETANLFKTIVLKLANLLYLNEEELETLVKAFESNSNCLIQETQETKIVPQEKKCWVFKKDKALILAEVSLAQLLSGLEKNIEKKQIQPLKAQALQDMTKSPNYQLDDQSAAQNIMLLRLMNHFISILNASFDLNKKEAAPARLNRSALPKTVEITIQRHAYIEEGKTEAMELELPTPYSFEKGFNKEMSLSQEVGQISDCLSRARKKYEDLQKYLLSTQKPAIGRTALYYLIFSSLVHNNFWQLSNELLHWIAALKQGASKEEGQLLSYLAFIFQKLNPEPMSPELEALFADYPDNPFFKPLNLFNKEIDDSIYENLEILRSLSVVLDDSHPLPSFLKRFIQIIYASNLLEIKCNTAFEHFFKLSQLIKLLAQHSIFPSFLSDYFKDVMDENTSKATVVEALIASIIGLCEYINRFKINYDLKLDYDLNQNRCNILNHTLLSLKHLSLNLFNKIPDKYRQSLSVSNQNKMGQYVIDILYQDLSLYETPKESESEELEPESAAYDSFYFLQSVYKVFLYAKKNKEVMLVLAKHIDMLIEILFSNDMEKEACKLLSIFIEYYKKNPAIGQMSCNQYEALAFSFNFILEPFVINAKDFFLKPCFKKQLQNDAYVFNNLNSLKGKFPNFFSELKCKLFSSIDKLLSIEKIQRIAPEQSKLFQEIALQLAIQFGATKEEISQLRQDLKYEKKNAFDLQAIARTYIAFEEKPIKVKHKKKKNRSDDLESDDKNSQSSESPSLSARSSVSGNSEPQPLILQEALLVSEIKTDRLERLIHEKLPSPEASKSSSAEIASFVENFSKTIGSIVNSASSSGELLSLNSNGHATLMKASNHMSQWVKRIHRSQVPAPILDLALKIASLTDHAPLVLGGSAVASIYLKLEHQSDYDLRIFNYSQDKLLEQLRALPNISDCQIRGSQVPVLAFKFCEDCQLLLHSGPLEELSLQNTKLPHYVITASGLWFYNAQKKKKLSFLKDKSLDLLVKHLGLQTSRSVTPKDLALIKAFTNHQMIRIFEIEINKGEKSENETLHSAMKRIMDKIDFYLASLYIPLSIVRYESDNSKKGDTYLEIRGPEHCFRSIDKQQIAVVNRRCSLVRMSQPPSEMPKEKLKILFKHSHGYALVDQSLYYINTEFQVLHIPINDVSNIDQYFLSKLDVFTDAHEKQLKGIWELTGHLPDKNPTIFRQDPIQGLRLIKYLFLFKFSMDETLTDIVNNMDWKGCFSSYLSQYKNPNTKNNQQKGRLSTSLESLFSRFPNSLKEIIQTMGKLGILEGMTQLSYDASHSIFKLEETMYLFDYYNQKDPYSQKKALYFFILIHFCFQQDSLNLSINITKLRRWPFYDAIVCCLKKTDVNELKRIVPYLNFGLKRAESSSIEQLNAAILDKSLIVMLQEIETYYANKKPKEAYEQKSPWYFGMSSLFLPAQRMKPCMINKTAGLSGLIND